MLTDVEGITLLEASRRMPNRSKVFLDATLFDGFIECHIEQGPCLHEAGYKIGVVTDIVGIRDCTVTFTGQQIMREQHQCIVVRMHFKRLPTSSRK